MQILQTTTFKKLLKKLHPSQKAALDSALLGLIANPSLGELKIGDLKGIRVYKFRMGQQLTLLAYIYSAATPAITLLALGAHENFYRDLKK